MPPGRGWAKTIAAAAWSSLLSSRAGLSPQLPGPPVLAMRADSSASFHLAPPLRFRGVGRGRSAGPGANPLIRRLLRTGLQPGRVTDVRVEQGAWARTISANTPCARRPVPADRGFPGNRSTPSPPGPSLRGPLPTARATPDRRGRCPRATASWPGTGRTIRPPQSPVDPERSSALPGCGLRLSRDAGSQSPVCRAHLRADGRHVPIFRTVPDS